MTILLDLTWSVTYRVVSTKWSFPTILPSYLWWQSAFGLATGSGPMVLHEKTYCWSMSAPLVLAPVLRQTLYYVCLSHNSSIALNIGSDTSNYNRAKCSTASYSISDPAHAFKSHSASADRASTQSSGRLCLLSKEQLEFPAQSPDLWPLEHMTSYPTSDRPH